MMGTGGIFGVRLTVTEKRRLIARSFSGACLWVARVVCARQHQALVVSG